jgi:hypothetical protein
MSHMYQCNWDAGNHQRRKAADITCDGSKKTRYNKIWRWCASRFRKTVLVHDVDNIAISALRNPEAQLDVEIMAVMVRPSKQAKWRGILFLHRVTATLLYQPCRGYDNVFWPAPSHKVLADPRRRSGTSNAFISLFPEEGRFKRVINWYEPMLEMDTNGRQQFAYVMYQEYVGIERDQSKNSRKITHANDD